MVIETHEPRKSLLPSRDNRSLRATSGFTLAPPSDRLAAAILDWAVVLTPLLLLLIAPLRRRMLESMILDTQGDLAVAISLGLLVGFLIIFLYQTISTYKWGATPGKLIFGLRTLDVWTEDFPRLENCALRSLIWMAESTLLLGLPWLSVVSNSQRRTLHDKIADTRVVSIRRPIGLEPTVLHVAFVRGIYSAAFVCIFAFMAILSYEALDSMQSEDKLMGWLGQEGGESQSCEAISAAVESNGEELSVEKRLQVAMEMFAGGLVGQKCLEQEADVVLNRHNQQSALAYLAMAFAHSEDAEVSNEYLAEACRLEPEGEPCQMSSIVQHWSGENWDKVEEHFENLPPSASAHVLVWKVRYLMRQGQYEQAMNLIERLSGRVQLAEYLIPERVKALWRSNHIEEARLVATTAFETLFGPDRLNLSGWMCYEELARQCNPNLPASCEQLVKDVHRDEGESLQTPGWLALVLMKEKCEGQTKSSDYLEIKEASGPGAIEQFVGVLDLYARGQKDEAKSQLKELIVDEKQPEAIRSEALRRIISWSHTGEDLKPWVEHWESLRVGLRRALGPTLYRALKARGELGEALQVGWKLLDENRADLEINRDLVVTAYQMGRHRDAWALLKSYRDRYDLLSNSRAPATIDEFVTITKLLRKEYGEP